MRVNTLGNFEGKSRLPRKHRATLEKVSKKNSYLPRQSLGPVEKYRGKIESTEAKFWYTLKITEAEVWLVLQLAI